jgi:protein-disulfide isomerase
MQSYRSLCAFLLLFSAPFVLAQQETPSAPTVQAPAPTSGISTLATPPAALFPPVDKANFTADAPTIDVVDTFIHKLIGYDSKRVWQVQAILKTPVDGVSKVVVLLNEQGKTMQDAQPLQFFTLPGGKFALINDVTPFGKDPFSDIRKKLIASATGPSRGAASKDVLFVEFADFQCPHCKDAQETVEKLLKDYPNAHFVYQNFPLIQIHSETFKATAYSICVTKAGGNAKFFDFVKDIFERQAGLTPDGSELTLKAAVVKVGLDPTPIAACAATPAVKAEIDAEIALAQEVNVSGTPTLFVNGRGLSIASIPYATLKQLIDFQIAEDGPAPK